MRCGYSTMVVCKFSKLDTGVRFPLPAYAPVAQWIERVASDHKVAGSTPAGRAVSAFCGRSGVRGSNPLEGATSENFRKCPEEKLRLLVENFLKDLLKK